MLACRYGHSRVVERLVDARADVNREDKMKQTPLRLAAGNGHHAATLELLCCNTLRLDDRDKSGRTALHLAAMNGHARAVTVLLEGGADVNAVDALGRPPLMTLSDSAAHIRVLRLLSNAGADLEIEDAGGHTALRLAALKGRHSVVKVWGQCFCSIRCISYIIPELVLFWSYVRMLIGSMYLKEKCTGGNCLAT